MDRALPSPPMRHTFPVTPLTLRTSQARVHPGMSSWDKLYHVKLIRPRGEDPLWRETDCPHLQPWASHCLSSRADNILLSRPAGRPELAEKGQSENRITLVRPGASQGLSVLDCPSMSPLTTVSTSLRPLLVY